MVSDGVVVVALVDGTTMTSGEAEALESVASLEAAADEDKDAEGSVTLLTSMLQHLRGLVGPFVCVRVAEEASAQAHKRGVRKAGCCPAFRSPAPLWLLRRVRVCRRRRSASGQKSAEECGASSNKQLT